jgi:mycothiol synthase
MLSTRLLRPPAPEAVGIATALEAAATGRDGHESLASFVWRDLAEPAPESTGIVVEVGSRPVGYAHLAPSDTEADPHLVAAIVVDPDHRDGAVARALLDAVVAEAVEHHEPVFLWLNGVTDELDAVVTAAGLQRFSEQHQMRVALPLAESPKWPADVTVRSFVPGQDDDDWLRVNNRAFSEHPDQGAWIRRTLERRMEESWFDPAGFLLAFDPDGLAGFCWTKVHPPEADDLGPIGEIYVIGVDPDRQGTGLGRALTVGGLEYLNQVRHCPTGMLYVDGENTAAVGLYRALGFTVHRTDRAYTFSPDGS